jgi:hypothetical protein
MPPAPVNDVANQENRGERGAHFHHEHHGVLHQRDRIQLDERILGRPAQNPDRTMGLACASFLGSNLSSEFRCAGS